MVRFENMTQIKFKKIMIIVLHFTGESRKIHVFNFLSFCNFRVDDRANRQSYKS